MRKKNDQDTPTKEQISEMTRISEDYRKSMKQIEENEKQLTKLTTQNKSCKSSFEVDLINDDISKLRQAIQKDEEETSYFRWALFYLDDRARSVMSQLYVDGYEWDSVQDSNGDPITPGTVGRIRKRSLYEMAKRVAQKRKEMEEKGASDEAQKCKNVSIDAEAE